MLHMLLRHHQSTSPVDVFKLSRFFLNLISKINSWFKSVLFWSQTLGFPSLVLQTLRGSSLRSPQHPGAGCPKLPSRGRALYYTPLTHLDFCIRKYFFPTKQATLLHMSPPDSIKMPLWSDSNSPYILRMFAGLCYFSLICRCLGYCSFMVSFTIWWGKSTLIQHFKNVISSFYTFPFHVNF